MRISFGHRPRNITCTCLLLASLVATVTPLSLPFSGNQEDVHSVTPYETFGIPRDAFSRIEQRTADPDVLEKHHKPIFQEINKTFRLLAKLFHPSSMLTPKQREAVLQELPPPVAKRVQTVFKNAPSNAKKRIAYFEEYMKTVNLHRKMLTNGLIRRALDLALLPWKECVDVIENEGLILEGLKEAEKETINERFDENKEHYRKVVQSLNTPENIRKFGTIFAKSVSSLLITKMYLNSRTARDIELLINYFPIIKGQIQALRAGELSQDEIRTNISTLLSKNNWVHSHTINLKSVISSCWHACLFYSPMAFFDALRLMFRFEPVEIEEMLKTRYNGDIKMYRVTEDRSNLVFTSNSKDRLRFAIEAFFGVLASFLFLKNYEPIYTAKLTEHILGYFDHLGESIEPLITYTTNGVLSFEEITKTSAYQNIEAFLEASLSEPSLIQELHKVCTTRSPSDLLKTKCLYWSGTTMGMLLSRYIAYTK